LLGVQVDAVRRGPHVRHVDGEHGHYPCPRRRDALERAGEPPPQQQREGQRGRAAEDGHVPARGDKPWPSFTDRLRWLTRSHAHDRGRAHVSSCGSDRKSTRLHYSHGRIVYYDLRYFYE